MSGRLEIHTTGPKSPARSAQRSLAPFALCLGLAALAGFMSACTIVDFTDPPLVDIEERSCRVQADCENVRFTVDESLRNDPCLVAVRSCNTGRERCEVTLQARDSDGDGFRDTACADVRSDFAPFDVDCDDADPRAFPNADLDGDGFVVAGCADGQPEDCDDTRATAFPGATIEACDGVVSTCTDSTPPARRIVEDLDGDRFASPDLDPEVCEDVFSDNGVLLSIPRTDCDDVDPNVYPGAPDVCDGRHNDCDSPIGVGPDDGEDGDGDGYASPTSLSCDPEAPGGLPNTDCDDLDPNSFPGAPETCDGIINNCSARLNGERLRPSEDPDGDGFYGRRASCVDAFVNIECDDAVLDRFSKFCLPGNERVLSSGIVDPIGVVAGDVNGDGAEELAYGVIDGNCGTDTTLYLRYGDSQFNMLNSQRQTCATGTVTQDMLLGDADGDGMAEVVTRDSSGVVQVYDLDSFSWQPKPNPSGSITLGAWVVGRPAGLGTPAIVTMQAGALVYLPLDADGVMGAAVTIDASPPSMTGLRLSDIDLDGRDDLIAYDEASTSLTIYRASGTGVFGAAESLDTASVLAGLGPVRDVAFGDVEGGRDGDVDIVVAGRDGLGLLANRGGTYEGVAVGVFPNGAGLPVGGLVAERVEVRDIGGAGGDEIVFISGERDSVGFIEEFGSGLLVQHVFVADLDQVAHLAVGDFDSDRDQDIAVYSTGFEQLLAYQSKFVSELQFSTGPIDRATAVTALSVFDFDTDGFLDLVGASDETGGEIVLWRARAQRLGDVEEIVLGSADVGEVITSIAAGDVSGDLRGDVVTGTRSTGRVSYIRGIGDLTFADRVDLESFDGISALVMTDLDGDGIAEVVAVAESGSDGVLALYVRAADSNDLTRTILAGGSAACVDAAVGDIDEDGDNDVALACGTDGVRVYLNPGSLSEPWQEVVVYDGAGGANASSVDVADVNRDGSADVISYRVDRGMPRVDLSQEGSFDGAPIEVELEGTIAAGALVRALDFDRDGDFDLIVAGQSAGDSTTTAQLISDDPPRYFPGPTLASDSVRALRAVPQFDGNFDVFVAAFGDSARVLAFYSQSSPWWND